MAIEAIGTSSVGGTGAGGGAIAPAGSAPKGKGFAESLGKLLETTKSADAQADTAVGQMLDGTGDVPEAMIALQQADLMLQLTVQVRNKIVQAYQDIMRMPV